MDHYLLIGAGGSIYDLGSFLNVSETLDLGHGALDQPVYAENAAVDGAQFAYESSRARTWRFPLVLPSGGAGLTLDGFQAAVRLAARPGVWKLVAKPAGVPSGEMVHFDGLAGRWLPDYHARERAVSRTRGVLELDTQPFGYWPTMILLASAASIGGPGVLAIPGGSVIGDVPGLAEVFVAPTTATSFGALQKTDAILWSLAARPSVSAFWPAGSAVTPTTGGGALATLTGNQYAPGSQMIQLTLTTVELGRWDRLVQWVIPRTLEPAYRGRYRAYAWCRLRDSAPNVLLLSLDAVAGTAVSHALASSMPVATLPPAVASHAAGGGQGASPAFHLLSLGEVTLPPVASLAQDTVLRLWRGFPATGLVVVNTMFDVGGLYLQPVDGPAGALPRGILQPTWTGASVLGRALFDGIRNDVIIGDATSQPASFTPIAAGLPHYRGQLPRVSASTVRLDLLLAGKEATAGAPTSHPPLRSEPHFAAVSVRYRPRFTFAKGI